MKDSTETHKQEFEEAVGNISQAVQKISDPVALATMHFSIAEERKSTNLIIREINAKLDKFEKLTEKIDKLEEAISKITLQSTIEKTPLQHITSELSERDEEVLTHVKEKGRVCAEELQEKFNYRGKNAASARLSKLFKEGKLDKIFVGRKVYYTQK
jgi:predicted HTH transcriptional regulator